MELLLTLHFVLILHVFVGELRTLMLQYEDDVDAVPERSKSVTTSHKRCSWTFKS